jgi:hypothetical protein
MFEMAWCVTLPADGNVITETCSMGRICAVVGACVVFANKTHGLDNVNKYIHQVLRYFGLLQ